MSTTVEIANEALAAAVQRLARAGFTVTTEDDGPLTRIAFGNEGGLNGTVDLITANGSPLRASTRVGNASKADRVAWNEADILTLLGKVADEVTAEAPAGQETGRTRTRKARAPRA